MCRRDRSRIYNYKPFLSNSLRNRGRGPTVKCWLERSILPAVLSVSGAGSSPRRGLALPKPCWSVAISPMEAGS